MRRHLQRNLIRALIMSFVVVLTPTPASAHSASNTPTSNFHARVTSVVPRSTRFTIEVIEATSRIELTWRSGEELAVPGYDNEPYLRVGPDGIFENQASNATYLNRDRQGATQLPANTGPDRPPVWKRVGKGATVRWHDHRVHWMGSTVPPIVAGNRNRPHQIQTWTIPITQGTTRHEVTGVLTWVPGPSSLPYLGVVAIVAASSILIAFVIRRRPRFIPITKYVAAATLTLIAIDAVHLVSIAGGVRGPGIITRLFKIGAFSFPVWIAGLVGTFFILRNRFDGLYLAVFAALFVAISGGFADVNVLSSSATASYLAIGTVRILVTATIAMGLAITIIGVALTTNTHLTSSETKEPS